METQPTNNNNGEKKPETSRKRRAAIYVGVLLLSYAVFLIVTFPYDLLAKGILSKAQSSFPVPINADSVSPKPPLGLKFTNLRIGPMSENDLEVIQIDSLDIKASLSEAIRRKIDGKAEAEIYNGKILLDYIGDDVSGDTEFRVVSVEIKPLLAFFKNLQWNVEGSLGGKGKLHLDFYNDRENNGTFKLTSKNLKMFNVDMKVTKADFEFTNATADIELSKGGTLTVKSLILEGTPCGFDVSGTIALNYMAVMMSRMDLEIVFRPSPEFEAKIPFNLLKKNNKGLYTGHLRGTVEKPIFP